MKRKPLDLTKLKGRLFKITPEYEREQAESERRQLADALWRRHEARKARRTRAGASAWLKFARELYAL